MRRFNRVNHFSLVTLPRPAEVIWLGNAVTHFKECHSHQTTVSGKKECYETYQSEKSEKQQ